MPSTRSPLSIFTGQNAQIRAVSLSHGVIRPNMVDAVDITPKLSSKRIPEFDNSVDALTYVTFDGGTGRLSYVRSNQGVIDALIMDTDPTIEQIFVNPANMQKFNLFANLKGLDGKIKGAYLVTDCRITGNPLTSTTKEGAKETLDFEFINAYKFSGLGILYTRARSTVGPVGQPTQPTLTPAGTGGFLGADTYYVRITAITATGESAGSVETAVFITSGSVNKITVDIPVVVSPITGYNVYVSNRSNGERLVASAVTADYDITALAPSSAIPCPNVDTTGSPQVTGDKIIPATTPFDVTLDKTAFKIAQNGLMYALVCKNGEAVGTVDNPATIDQFLIANAGDKFSVLSAPSSADYWDIFTLYQP